MINDLANFELRSPSLDGDSIAAERRAERRAYSRQVACDIINRFAASLPTERPFDWCIRELILNDADTKGAFNPDGRRYLEDIINDNDAIDVRQQTVINGTGTGKTLSNIAGIAWKIKHKPCRGLMVMPATKGEGGSESFAATRLIPALKATDCLRELFPAGQERLYLNSKKVRLNGAHFGFVGANSTGQLGSNRCGDVRLDEADKYKGQLGNEAGTDSLAKERTEGVEDYQVFRNTTPTVETGIGWRKLMQSDFRRRFLPCPHCNSAVRGKKDEVRTEQITPLTSSLSPSNLKGWFDLAWSEQYCVLPNKFEDGTAVPRAYIHWDREAKRKDGSWDLDRVFNSTRIQCPHCGGHVLDQHKPWMDKNGLWLPLKAGFRDHRGYHLSSLYAPSFAGNEQSKLGGRALKFFEAYEDALGMKGFINSTLAEVDALQEHGSLGAEINSAPLAQPDWVALLTADFHKNHPYIWFVVRKWCAFKLLPPFSITNGIPDFAAALEAEENLEAKKNVLQLAGKWSAEHPLGQSDLSILNPQFWTVISELMRFDSRTGRSPIVDFLIAQKITGEALIKLYREDCTADTLAFRKKIYELMATHSGHPAKGRAPRGGDSELIAAGYCDLSGEACWEELAEIAGEFQVGHGMPMPSRCVAIDCGFAEKFNRTVLQKCYETADDWQWYDPLIKNREPVFWAQARHQACLRAPLNGWQAIRGKPTFRPQGTGQISRDLGRHIEDPYYGTPTAGTCVVDVLEIPTDLFFLRTLDLREKRTKQQYAQSPQTEWFPKLYQPDGTRTASSKFKREDYDRQINEQIFDDAKNIVRPRHGKGGLQSRLHPYHLGDCESYQTALASHLEFFEESTATKK